METLARAGYAAKGVVYFVAGVLALQVAFGADGQTTGKGGAIRAIADEPFGNVMLILLAIGLAAYALWRLGTAVLDTEQEGRDAEGWAKRIGYVGSFLAYAALAVLSLRIVLGSSGGSGSGGSQKTESLTALVMNQPLGRWLIAAFGVALLVRAGMEMHKSYSVKFQKELKLGEMNATMQTWAKRLGRAGLAARGIVFAIIGSFFIAAAVQADPGEARGLGGTLETLAQQPYGPYLLGLTAAGLTAYGVYAVILARFRRVGEA
ncbi:MAG: DUF1206 domain-containing protein [Bacteroidota bacterium]